MPDGFTDTPGGDDLDFRPLPSQPPQRKPAPQPRAAASDGIDFQPSTAAPRATRSQASPPASEIDFQPSEKPLTFDDLHKLQTPAVSLSDRAARVGEPMIRLGRPDNLYVDTTGIRRSPFTNELEFQPPIVTEEEKRRSGTIGAPEKIRVPGPHGTQVEIPADTGTGLVRALGAGAPSGSLIDQLKGRELTQAELERERQGGMRLFAPEELMTEAEQRQHPILTGAGQFAGGFTTPEGLMLLGLTAGAGELAGPGAQTVKRLLAAGFSGSMLYNAAQKVPAISKAISTGDSYNAQRLMTQLVLETGTAGLAARGAFEEPAPLTVPKGTISSKLATDEAVARGGRRFQEFQANDAARQGMGRLEEAERGIEAARQARINAPVQVPRTYEGEPPILPGRPQGPERNPLEVEAQRVREERAEREQPTYTVRDLRRVVPENPEEQPYYVLSGATPSPQPEGAVRPGAGDLVGARGRSATMSDLASRTVPKIENSLAQRFGPDVLDEARQELNAAAGLASSFERPGRYFSENEMGEPNPQREQRSDRGTTYAGHWYGVGSGRGMIEEMHPWFRDIAEGPETLSRIVQKGQGAAYDRLLERAATHIQAERETARPIVEEFAPQLRDLAGQVREVDPDLAGTLQSLAEGKSVGFQNLREYIEGKIHDAQTAATFSRAIDEAAAEARDAAGTEEAAQPGSAAREEDSRGETAARESAGAIDFQPTNPQEYSELATETIGAHPRGLDVMRRGEFANPRGAEELRNVLASGDVERNIEAGLRGERGDEASRIREEHRTKLERGEILPGMETAVREQREAAAAEQGRQLTERANRPPESIEETAGKMERESPLFRGNGPQGELYSGLHPRALVGGARVLQRAWDEKIAQPFINKVLKLGDKYQKAREADPAVAEGLHLLDNAPQYLRAKAAQEVHNIIGGLSRAQERLFTLLADADSRENLRTNHPQEYAQAQRDPAIQEALRKYRPIEQELTQLRQKMGGEVLDQDYLRRIYEKHVAGVNKPQAPSTSGERATSAYDRVIRPQRIGNLSREATAEYHYREGLHEFGPAFATKYIGTHLRALRDSVAREFINKATMLPAGASEPRFIIYEGERYYRPDLAREMRAGGAKNVKEYDRYDPTAGEKFPVPADGKFLGPRELVKTLTDFGRREESQPGALRRFFQEQILGFGFGVPHIANIMRRVSQTVPGGAANPQGWLRAWNVVLSKELRARGIEGLNDPTFDMLAQRGAIPTSEMAALREYWGGNLNPANWARKMAAVGHKALFEPGSFGGFGGLDQRARLYIADLVRSQRPGLTDSQIADAVRTQLGDYSRSNWTDRQKMLSKFMMFPGWDFSSVKWVLQHPIKTTVPPALLVLLSNQVLHQLGQNRPEDQYDISNIHVGDRAYGSSLIRESVARNLFRPALAYAQSKIRGESDQRAMAEAARGVTAGAGGLLSMLRPDLSGFLAMATNRQALFSGKELVSKDDFAQPGKVLPSRAIEKEAVFALRHAVPALDRMLDANEEIDLRSFAGGNLGLPNYRDDAEKRLLRNAAEAEEVHRTIAKLAKSNPELARQYVKDPDNAAFALFYHDLNGLTSTLKRMDEAKQRIDASGLQADDKKARIATIEKARENLLEHADGLGNLLFERREKAKPQDRAFAPGGLLRMLRSVSPQPTQTQP